MLWPDSTSRTASCLNSSVYRARVAFIIIFPFADSQLRDTFRGGKISRWFKSSPRNQSGSSVRPNPISLQQHTSCPVAAQLQVGRNWFTLLWVIVPPPPGTSNFLQGPDLVQGTSLEQFPVFHDVINARRILDILQRVFIEHDEVGQLARFDAAEILCHAYRLSAIQGSSAKRI